MAVDGHRVDTLGGLPAALQVPAPIATTVHASQGGFKSLSNSTNFLAMARAVPAPCHLGSQLIHHLAIASHLLRFLRTVSQQRWPRALPCLTTLVRAAGPLETTAQAVALPGYGPDGLGPLSER